ncbi:MAG TPA: response regulator transcription factor, partial [Verrucomicrobiae bacterium]|nr:response regulator transcription factor [Verrucomicrobiae bacterium]
MQNRVETGGNFKASIIIADEQPFMREGLRQWLDRQADLVVHGEADSIASTIEQVEKSAPDLLLIEVRLRQDDVLDLIKSLRARFPLMRILVHAQSDENFYAERALRAGAHGYIMKREAPEEVLIAIRRVLRGELYLSRQMSSALLARLLRTPSPNPAPRPLETLSDREFQVFHMLGSGLKNRQIAANLKLSVKTIETYRENIKHKFGIQNSAELLRHAMHWLESGGQATLRGEKAGTTAAALPALLSIRA